MIVATTKKVEIDTRKSKVYWKGTKMAASGSHEGTLSFRSGYLVLTDGRITGGKLEIGMESLEVTDIPVHEPVPRNALTTHLKEEFETASYAIATFTVQGTKGNTMSGRMAIMGRSAIIAFPYKKTTNGYTAELRLSREKWGIGKKASWLEKRLVDDDIQLKICIATK